MSPSLLRKTLWLLGCSAWLSFGPGARADEGPVITAVAAQASDDYVRVRLANGSFEPEAYVFGEGGVWGGAGHDPSMDKLKFLQVARTIAAPLAQQHYLPAHDPSRTKLLIMVYWGQTAGAQGTANPGILNTLPNAQALVAPPPGPPPSSAAGAAAAHAMAAALATTPENGTDALLSFANRARDRQNLRNAGLLGYDLDPLISEEYGNTIGLTARWDHQHDLVDDLEENRYFVILMAYDFPLLLKGKKHKLLWETRFSIRQQGNNFDEQLAAMAKYASRYFGRDSHGLLRRTLPEEHVELGELKFLGVTPDKR
jgi:hypothetical protein